MRVRRTVLLLGLLVSALLPASAFAQPPANDAQSGAAVLEPSYAPSSFSAPTIFPTSPSGGWTDATNDASDAVPPRCLGALGFHTMWYSIKVPEASVLTVTLTSTSVQRYQPWVTIIDGKTGGEVACGLGGSDTLTDPTASASSYVPAGDYFVRIGSVQSSTSGVPSEGPSLILKEILQDVTPPAIQVSVSGKTRIVGPGKLYTFDATGTTDTGSGVNPQSAVWVFYEHGKEVQRLQGKDLSQPLILSHSWGTPGLHQVSLQVADKAGNVNSYAFNVLVHNFVPPVVSLRFVPPPVGAGTMKLKVTHDVPIKVKIVVLQGKTVLRTIPSKLLKGSGVTTTVTFALKHRVRATDFVVVTGVASDIGQYPNTVPLISCSVDPVNGGGTCA